MKKLTDEQIGFICEDAVEEIEDFPETFEDVIGDNRYTFASVTCSRYSRENILMSMINYRVDNDVVKAKYYLSKGQIAVSKMQSLQRLLELLADAENIEIGKEPNCILMENLETPIYISLLNKRLDDINRLQLIQQSDATEKSGGFPFAQQFAPLLLKGCLDQTKEFNIAYSKFKEIKSIKNNAYEQWQALYVDMLNAVVGRDQDDFDRIQLVAESGMQNHAIDKKWGEDFMSGGLEDNVLVYDYQGTAMCCLAVLRGMQVNHFSKYYPKEIILD